MRVNHKRNIVAADSTMRACLEELMAVTELHGIPVTARLPASCGKSTGFLHGVGGGTADRNLLEAIEYSVPVLSATREVLPTRAGPEGRPSATGPSDPEHRPTNVLPTLRPGSLLGH